MIYASFSDIKNDRLLKKPLISLHQLIIGLAILKLLIHLLTNTNYGFHRDEFLYLDQGNHLAWGFMEVPPMIAVLAKITQIFGESLFVVRLLPALIGAFSVYLLGVLVKQLGGRAWAIVFTALAFIIAPAFLRSNSLFQPVSFNQFFWLLSAYWIIQLIRNESPKYWWALGLTAGFGFLTKYSIVFYLIALIGGVILSKHRVWLLRKDAYIALGIAALIALPNLLWQYQHNFPVMVHMEELRETQLVNVDPVGFFADQLFFFLGGTVIWMAGLLALFFNKVFKEYRLLGWGSLIAILIIFLLGGKSYYTIGAYSILLVFGGLAIEQYIRKSLWKWVLGIFLLLNILPFLPFSLPLLPNVQMEKYCRFMIDEFGFDGPMRWEDGQIYALPQDYADMNGWEEMVANLSKAYHQLSPEEKEECLLIGGGYGHAGAINYYREKYDLPEACSFNSSYLIWLPNEVDFEMILHLDDNINEESEWFSDFIYVDSLENSYARDPGYIYIRKSPRTDVSQVWNKLVKEEKAPFNFE